MDLLGRFFILAFIFILTSCNSFDSYRDYKRPDLYYPHVELDKAQLGNLNINTSEEKDSVSIQVIPAVTSLDPSFVAPYKFTVSDKCSNNNKANRKITIYPQTIPIKNPTSTQDTMSFEIEPMDISRSASSLVQIEYQGCRANDIDWTTALNKKLSIIKNFKVDNTNGALDIKSASQSLIYSTIATPYKIQVGDTCTGANAGNPTVVNVAPPEVAIVPSRQAGSRWIDITIDPTKLKDLNSVTIMARSCQAQNLSWDSATKMGLAKIATYPVNTLQFNNVTSDFNVWSKDDVRDEFGDAFSNTFFVADVVFVNRNKYPILVYGSTITAQVRFLASKKDVKERYGKEIMDNPESLLIERRDIGTLYDRLNWKENYRPMSFSDVLAIFTYQQESAPKQRIIAAMKSLGTLLTGGAVFGASESYIEGVSFFTGVVNPETEKLLLWDILLHVKNLEERSLKEVEEVAANGELRKVVFFPRRPIYGILPEMPVYIAEIRPDPADAEATVIEKKATISATAN